MCLMSIEGLRSVLSSKQWGRARDLHLPLVHCPNGASALDFELQTLTGRQRAAWSSCLFEVLGCRVVWFLCATGAVLDSRSARVPLWIHFRNTSWLLQSKWKQQRRLGKAPAGERW